MLKDFYKLFIPIALTMFLSSILTLIDAIMITSYEKSAISAISIVSQVQFLFGPVYFAVMTGISVYSVQYFTRNDFASLQKFAGIALTLLIPLAVVNFLIYHFLGDQIINLFIANDASSLITQGNEFIQFFKYSILFIPFEMFFMYQYRAIKKPKLSMYIGILQAVLNVGLNYLLIFGNFGFPKMGISGAALGTLLAKIIICLIYLIISIKTKVPFIGKFNVMFSYSQKVFNEILKNVWPLIIIELGFGLGNVFYTKIYASTTLEEFTMFNIARSTSLTINSIVIATANVVGIMIGGKLATKELQKELQKTLKTSFKFITLNAALILLISALILPLTINFYNPTIEQFNGVKTLIIINGIWLAMRIYSSSLISILKSGNDNRFIIFVDAGTTFIFGIPIALIAVYLFDPTIFILRFLIIFDVIPKIITAFYRYKKQNWIKII